MREVKFEPWWPSDPAGEKELERQFQKTAEAQAGSEAAREAAARVVDELAPQETFGQEKKSVAEHMADSERRGHDLFSDPRILARARQLSPTPEYLAEQRIKKEEAWREEVRAQYRDEDYARASQRIEAEVDNMSPEEISNYLDDAQGVYSEVDEAPNEWTAADEAEFDGYGLTDGGEAQYKAEQAELRSQFEADGEVEE